MKNIDRIITQLTLETIEAFRVLKLVPKEKFSMRNIAYILYQAFEENDLKELVKILNNDYLNGQNNK